MDSWANQKINIRASSPAGSSNGSPLPGLWPYNPKYEMGFARNVANRVIFFDQGNIVEEKPPDEFSVNPEQEQTKLFLSQILHH